MTNLLYSISSDHHCHAWSQFSTINDDGVNSRLRHILDELERQARDTVDESGNLMLLAGDLFHVRGSIDPEVLNPTMDTFRKICVDMNVEVYAIAGNHDLSTKDASRIGNSMQALDDIPGFNAVTEPTWVNGSVFMVPWFDSLDELRTICKSNAKPDMDLIIHAPMNGVIKGIPDHGLEADEVKQWGYRRVFCGHYHDRKELRPDVWSVGATTHQTWGDPGSKAGYIMVRENETEEVPSIAPAFLNYDGGDVDDVLYRGNYVRMRLKDATEDEITAARRSLLDAGALGVVNHSTKKREVTRGISSATNVALDVSVASYVKDSDDFEGLSKKRIAKDALSILDEARNLKGTEDA